MADETYTEPDSGKETGAEEMRDTASKRWLDLIDDAAKCFRLYQEKCDSIDKLYADLESLSKSTADREFQIFWANLEVLKPSLYARPPIPVVMPRFKNYKELPRKSAEVLERAEATLFETEDIHGSLLQVRDDVAIHSRGVLWLRYTASDAKGERVRFDHVDRTDFLHDPARKWSEVDWVARRVWLTRKQMMARFEETSGDAFMRADFKEQETDKEKSYKGERKAAVWELWHRRENIVVWVSPGVEDVLDQRDPFLSLDGFFPCPAPAYGTTQRRSLVPVPDFLYYKDQVEEINEITARISALAEGLRLRGFYPAGASELGEAIEAVINDMDNRRILVGVSNFGALGGASLKESIVWLPVEEVATVIQQLILLRRQLIEDVYQITGLSDIMRGETDPNETLGAQELKSQYGSVRIRQKQEELVRIARDACRMAAEIMAENFAPETLMAMSQVDDLPTDAAIQQQMQQIDAMVMQAKNDPRVQMMVQQNPQAAQQILQKAEEQKQALMQQVTWEKVIALLREERIRPFVLDIETDSTIQPDENAEKMRRTEFITAVGGFIGQAVPAIQMERAAAPLVGDLLKFLAAGYRAGRELEQSIEGFVEAMKQQAQQPPPPDPQVQKAQMDAELKREEMQMEGTLKSRELAIREAEVNGRLIQRANGEAAGEGEAMVPAPEAQTALGAMVQSQQQQTQLLQALMAMVEEMKAIAAAPKRIVRDGEGRAQGVEVVTQRTLQ